MEIIRHIISLFKDRAKEVGEGEITYNFKNNIEKYFTTLYFKDGLIFKIDILLHTDTERITLNYRLKPRIIIPDEHNNLICTKTPKNYSIPFINFDLSLNK